MIEYSMLTITYRLEKKGYIKKHYIVFFLV